MKILAFCAAALLMGAAASSASANGLTFRLTAHVPLSCWTTAEGKPRCNAPAAPGAEVGADGFAAEPRLQATSSLRPDGRKLISFVAF
ncbi:hypothetical protein [Neomegalonema perideroedes]|uniref:hypothetical protein n=1 Tax=Neomegalonema perideroedes TaxID=217219 RepID=UPI00035C52CC|nr:hypothetical protein [Neomegalonema perideroedes]